MENWLTSSPVRAIIGDLWLRDEDGALVSSGLQGVPGNVHVLRFPANHVVEVPAVMDGEDIVIPAVTDPYVWVQLHLYGDAEISDFAGPPGENDFDRWEHSKLVNLMSSKGRSALHRGVSTFEITTGPAKGISIFRGSEMEGTIKFHEVFAGNHY